MMIPARSPTKNRQPMTEDSQDLSWEEDDLYKNRDFDFVFVFIPVCVYFSIHCLNSIDIYRFNTTKPFFNSSKSHT